MKINVSNKAIPGVRSERTLTMNGEIQREAVYASCGYIGEVIYVARKTKAGTEYGWRPAKVAAQSKLTTKVEAIRRLAHSDGVVS